MLLDGLIRHQSRFRAVACRVFSTTIIAHHVPSVPVWAKPSHLLLVHSTPNAAEAVQPYEMPCEFSGSMQHLLAVYWQESGTLKFFAVVDLGAALCCPVPTAYRVTGRFSLADIAATAGWCFRLCRAARDCGDHRSRPSHLWPH